MRSLDLDEAVLVPTTSSRGGGGGGGEEEVLTAQMLGGALPVRGRVVVHLRQCHNDVIHVGPKCTLD